MHFLAMLAFAAIVAVVFALLNAEVSDSRARLIYGLKVFAAFVGIGLAIGILMYPFPR